MGEWDESLLLSYEKDALGFYITGHPLAQFEKRLRLLVSHTLGQLDEEKDFNNEVRVAGIIGAVKPLKTKKDERFVSFVLEDLSGRIEVVAFPESYKKYYEALREGNLVWLKGRFMGEGESKRISLTEIMPLADAFQKQAKRFAVRIFLPGLEESVLKELKETLEKSPGECPGPLPARDAARLPSRRPVDRGPERRADRRARPERRTAPGRGHRLHSVLTRRSIDRAGIMGIMKAANFTG